MAKIVTVEQMRAVERAADAAGLSYEQMMENAGRAVAQAILDRVAIEGARVVILVGSGNNGGDGLVAGHYLAQAGGEVSAYLSKKRPDGDVNLSRLRQDGASLMVAAQDGEGGALRQWLESADVVVDALLGTGARLPLRGKVREVLKQAKAFLESRDRPPFVVAVDCPSGLDCDTGEIAAEALRADLTVTLAAAKPGLLKFPGAGFAGELVIGEIGIPDDQEELARVEMELATPDVVKPWLPTRPRDAHKGTFGRAIVVAGSINFPGAAALAAEAAYRVGAGLVTLAVPTPVQGLIAPGIPEATWMLLPHEMGVIAAGAAELLRAEAARAQSILIGPGFGLETETAEFIAAFLGGSLEGQRGGIGFVHGGKGEETGESALPPCVVDADGLKLLTRLREWPRRLPQGSVLTPHPGEMAILTGQDKREIQADRVGAAKRWAEAWGHVVVLKGAFTVVSGPDGRAAVLPFATPALARAGTGDVLAGAIVGLKAQGVAPFEAAVLGAYLHGRAGEFAHEQLGTAASVLAGDVAAALAEAIFELESR